MGKENRHTGGITDGPGTEQDTGTVAAAVFELFEAVANELGGCTTTAPLPLTLQLYLPFPADA